MFPQKNLESASCKNCRYYQPENEDCGYCHYHAPTTRWSKPAPEGKEPFVDWMPYVNWPLVLAEDYCAKFDPQK